MPPPPFFKPQNTQDNERHTKHHSKNHWNHYHESRRRRARTRLSRPQPGRTSLLRISRRALVSLARPTGWPSRGKDRKYPTKSREPNRQDRLTASPNIHTHTP